MNLTRTVIRIVSKSSMYIKGNVNLELSSFKAKFKYSCGK